MSSELIEATGYLVIEGVENQYGVMNGAKFVKATTRLPQMDGDQRAIHMRIKVPKKVFEPFAHVDIEIPEGEVIFPLIEVEA